MTRELANRPEHPDVVLIDDVPTIELAGNLHEIGVQFYNICRGPVDALEDSEDGMRSEWCSSTSVRTVLKEGDGDDSFHLEPRNCRWADSGRCRVKAGELVVRYMVDDEVAARTLRNAQWETMHHSHQIIKATPHKRFL